MMSLSQISVQVMVGSTPKDVGDVRELCDKHGVTSVLSLQTNADLRSRGINIDLLETQYQKREMNFQRFPIDDVSPEDMAQKILLPIQYLVDQVNKDKLVYVHCNAGICRATSTVLGYLYLEQGMTMQQGLEYIRSKRPIANPYVSAVTQALEQGN